MLNFASKLTETPNFVGKDEVEKLHQAGWDESAIWEIVGLVSFFNFSGRMEAVSGLPPDEIPAGASFTEGIGQ